MATRSYEFSRGYNRGYGDAARLEAKVRDLEQRLAEAERVGRSADALRRAEFDRYIETKRALTVAEGKVKRLSFALHETKIDALAAIGELMQIALQQQTLSAQANYGALLARGNVVEERVRLALAESQEGE